MKRVILVLARSAASRAAQAKPQPEVPKRAKPATPARAKAKPGQPRRNLQSAAKASESKAQSYQTQFESGVKEILSFHRIHCFESFIILLFLNSLTVGSWNFEFVRVHLEAAGKDHSRFTKLIDCVFDRELLRPHLHRK